MTTATEQRPDYLRSQIARLEEERESVRARTKGHYSRTVRDGAFDRLDDIDTLLERYRADLAELEAEAIREEAREHDRRAAESWQRSDTDGFVSQWASGLSAQEARFQADIVEAGGVWEFPALLDAATGERVKAKIVRVPGFHGGTVSKWIVLDDADNALEWVPAFKSGPRSKLAKLGLVEGREKAPAKAALGGGSGRGLSGAASVHVIAKRTDDGYPEGARTLDAIRASVQS